MYGNQDVVRQYIQNQGQDEKEYIKLHKGQLIYPDPWVGELHWEEFEGLRGISCLSSHLF